MEWHLFSQTKLAPIFRNIFLIYNKQIKASTPFKEIAHSYGLFSIKCNVTLYNELCTARLSTEFSDCSGSGVIYLHKCNIYRSQFDSFIKEIGDKQFTYEEAYNKLLELYDINTGVKPDESGLKDSRMPSNLAKREEGWGKDPDECVIYHSDVNFQPERREEDA